MWLLFYPRFLVDDQWSPIRVVPLLLHCGGGCFSAGRKAPPYGFVPHTDYNQLFIIHYSSFIIHHFPCPTIRLCPGNAVVLRPTGSDSRGRLSLRIVPR